MSGRTTHVARANWENRFRARGAKFISVRLSPAAAQRLAALMEENNCSTRDAVEGLLLGNVPTLPDVIARAMREHGLSEAEARYVIANGIAA